MQLMIRNIVQKRASIGEQLATSLLATGLSALALGSVVLLVSSWVAPDNLPVFVIAMILVADLFLSRIVDVASAGYIAVRRMKRAAACVVLLQLVRLMAAVAAFIGLFEMTLKSWSVAYSTTTLLAAIVVVVVAARDLGLRRPDLARYKRDAPLGYQFSVGLASQSIYNDIDKAMLGSLSTTAAAGLYTAAFRLMDVAFTPVRAMLGAAEPRFFEKGGQGGLRATLSYARKLATPAIGYSILASFVLVACAPLAPVVLGASFAEATLALRFLAFLTVVRAAQYLLADSLTGAGYQGRRTVAQICIAVLNVGLNVWLIPLYSWQGAVVSSILCDALLLLILWAIAAWTLRSEDAVVSELLDERTSF
ncbi:Membrane protein involved in the export of O-antigen and teichoic acid [Nocardioides sp. AX2bis]|nr:Membrane protein involved in the export of O-antigen and teichoic acid [Nocardioides sp. AX2bis]